MKKSDCDRSELLRGLLKGELLLDGAMGSMLIAKTKKSGGFIPESCNIICPETVREIHKAYLSAGSAVICANTFGANPVKYPNEWEQYLSLGLKLAKEVCADFEKATGRLCFTALDAGPTGRIIGKVLRDSGIRILGGCCGTTPEHIAELRQMLDSGDSADPSAV